MTVNVSLHCAILVTLHHILHFQQVGTKAWQCAGAACADVLRYKKRGQAALQLLTHTEARCDRRLPRPWQALLSPAKSNTGIPVNWGKRPRLWWICPCKYIPFPLTKHHHMSEPGGPAFCRAQEAPAIHCLGDRFFPFSLSGAPLVCYCSPNTSMSNWSRIKGENWNIILVQSVLVWSCELHTEKY